MANSPANETELLKQCLDIAACTKCIIKESSIGGRGLYASQLIKKGTLIFANKPLVKGARADCEDTHCCTCHRISNSCSSCYKCTLLYCSEECASSQEHIQVCNFIVKHMVPKTEYERNSQDLTKVLIFLHYLLLTDEQRLLLSVFQTNNAKSSDEEIDVLCSKYVISKDHEQFMRLASSVMKINSFRIANSTREKRVPLRGLYPLSSFLNHNCVPNTMNVFENDYTMKVYATRDIEPGEEVVTCYTGLLWSTPVRRYHLYRTKHFWCKCERCKDRTEMGTHLSALNCFNRACNGVLLPVDPLLPGSRWRCDTCESTVSPSQVSTVQSVLGSLVGTFDMDDEFHLENFALERLVHFTPYSNHILVELRLKLALKLGYAQRLNELSESRVSLKENLCRGTLRTLAALGVGDGHLRGLLLYHLHAALAERARRAPDQYEELKAEIESTIEQAYCILQGDISAPPDLELRRRYLGPGGSDKPPQERFFILDA